MNWSFPFAMELKFSICNEVGVFQIWQLLYLYNRKTIWLWKSVNYTLYIYYCAQMLSYVLKTILSSMIKTTSCCNVVLKFLGWKLYNWIHSINSFSSYMSVCMAMVILSMMTMMKTMHCAIFWSETIFLLVWETAMPSCRRATFYFLIKSFQTQKGLVNRDISRESWFNMFTFSFWLLFISIYNKESANSF